MESRPAIQPGDLTIVLPTRDEEHNILPFLASLSPSIALIVVDASNDRTPHLIRAARSDRTTIIHSDSHIAEARNIGARAAQTPWLLFTDADVSFAPDYFEKLQLHGAPTALYGPKSSQQAYRTYYRCFALGQRLMASLGIPAVSGSNFLMRRSVFLATGGFDPLLRCNEDSEYGWRLARCRYDVKFAPDLLVYEHDHRRLQRGMARKTFHSLLRCTLLYTGLMPAQLQTKDWGYWS